MLRSLQDTSPNFSQQIIRRIIPIVIVIFSLYLVIIGISVFNTVANTIETDHEQTSTILQAQLIGELNSLLSEAEEVGDQLRLDAASLVAGDASANTVVNQLFANMIRFNADTYLRVQYIASNGAIINEVVNERGIPRILGDDVLPRNDESVDRSESFKNALAANNPNNYYLSNWSLETNSLGEPIVPLQATIDVYIPIFDLDNPRFPLGTVRFVIAADSLLQLVNNPILSNSSLERQLFLIDNQGNIIADSNSQSPDYLLHLVDETFHSDSEDLHDVVADHVATLTDEVTINSNDGLLYTIRNFRTNDNQNTAWKLIVTDPQSLLFSQFAISIFFVALVSILVMVMMIYFIYRRVEPILEPIMDVNQQAAQFTSGQSDNTPNREQVPFTENQAPGTLHISSALATLSDQIQDLTGELSNQSTRYNRDMQIITNIGRETATLYNINSLMQRSIELICTELGYYHAQIFLVDDVNANAVLVESRGEAGQKMLEREHKLAIGSDSVIGTVTSQAIPVIVNDTTTGVHGFNPFLPDTRAEMALPLIIGDEVIGAIDIQSVEPNVFHEEDLVTFQLIADQLAVAINNAQLRNQTDQRIEQINRLNRQLTRNSWAEAQDAIGFDFNYTYNLLSIDDQPTQIPEGGIAAPITIRGEVVGTLNATPPEGLSFSEGDLAIVRAVADRVALAIENARLFQETQVVLSETEILYELSRNLSESSSYDNVITSTIEAVAPDAKGGEIWIFDEYIIGDKPDWARITTETILRHTDDATAETRRLYLPKYNVFNQLTGDNILVIEDVTAHASRDENFYHLMSLLQAQSIVFVPFGVRGQWRGFMSIYFDQPHMFNERERRIYNALIDQAGVTIDNRLLLEQTEDALERNAKLYTSSRIINTAQSLQDLVYAAIAMNTATNVDFWLGIFDNIQGDTDWYGDLRIIARSEMGNVSEVDELHTVHIPSTSPMMRGEPEIVTDHVDNLWMWETSHTFVSAFPLFSDNQPIALFFIVSYEDYHLSTGDYEVYRALTGQMSTQVQNSRLLEQTELALAETQRLYIASRAIAGATDIDSIFDSAAGHLAMPFLQNAGEQQIMISLLTAHPNPTQYANQLQYRYQWRSDADMRFDVPTSTIVSSDEAPFAQLFDSRVTAIYYADINLELQEQPILHEVLSKDGGKSAIIAVLQTRQNWYGVLICKSSETHTFDQRYIEFVQAVANQIAIGMENQILFDAAQSERERLQTILSTLPTGVIVLDPETFIPILVNDSIANLFGREVNMDEPFSAITYKLYRTGTDTHYPEDELPIVLATQTGLSEMVDDLALIEDDYRIDLLLSAAPIFDSEGNQTAIVAAFQDIRNLRSLEQTLQENLRTTISSYEAQRSFTQADTLEEVIDTIIAQLEPLAADNALVILADEITQETILAHQMVGELDDIRAFNSMLPDESSLNIRDVDNDSSLTEEARFLLNRLSAKSVLILSMRVPRRLNTLGWIMMIGHRVNQFSAADEREVSSLGDMARTAIDNRYLVQSTQIALQEARTLYAATTTITRASDFDELGQAIEQSVLALHPDMYSGFIATAPNEYIELFNVGFDESITNGMDMEVLRTSRIPDGSNGIYISDVTRTTIGPFEEEILNGKNIRSFTAINLRAKDMHSGRLLLGFKTKRNFSEGDTRYLSSIADSTSVVIDNQTLLRQIQSTLQETSVLYQSSRALTDATTTTEIIDVVINYLIGPHVNQVFVAVLNRREWDLPGATVEIEAGWQSDGGVNLEGVTLSADQFPAWAQLSHPGILMINDIYDEELGLDIMQRTSIESLDTRSLVIIPLRVSNRAIGSIWIGSREAYHYTDADVRIFQAFAESASLSLEASYLFTQTEHRARQLETSAQVGQTVGQILDLNVLLPLVVDLIREQFNYDHVQVFLMDNNNEYAVLKASTGEAGQQLLAINHKLARGSQSVVGQVTKTGKPNIALDTADANVVHQPNQVLPLTRSEMALPLIVKGQVAGALDVQSNQPNAFSDEDVRALTTLAGQIAIAIDNASLYEEIERRASDMSLLFDTTVIATTSSTLTDALQAVTDNLHDALDASAVVFYLPQKYASHLVLRAVAMTGSDQPMSELSEIVVGDSANLIGLVAKELNSELIPNITEEVRYLSIVPSSSTAMISPISTGGQLIGLIAVEHQRVNAFSQDDLQLVNTLAGSLSAIVENSQLVDELQKSNDQLREVDRLKSQFLANMSHELRTPLNSIIGFSRVMLKGIDGALTEMQEQDLTTIYNSGQHLLNLINDILDQAKIESGKMDLKFAFFGVKTLIESVKSIGIGLVKEKPVDLLIDLESGLPQAYGDEFRTRQILLNIVSNASKFTSEGTITLRAYTIYNEVVGQKYIRIDVADTGIGIHEKDIPLLFETFRQVDSSLTRTVGGTGLGLPLSKSLAEMQGGELLIASEVGVGSVFSVTLPTVEVLTEEDANAIEMFENETQSEDIKPDTKKTNRTVTTEAVTVEGNHNITPSLDKRVITQTMKQTTKREILLIEDNKDMVDQYRRLLQREGFEVQTADHPMYAEAMVSNLRPTVLVMDVNFADGEGWTILENLKRRDDTFDIPIVICSVDPNSERAYQIGAHQFITRPFTNEEIVEAVLDAEKESQRERILIIDDQPESIRLLEELLNENGNYRIFSADNGTEGISLVARRQPNLIILDLRMPEMDGFAVLHELRSNPETVEIPVMIITGEIDLSADEQKRLENVHILQKTNISEEKFESFISKIRSHLDGNY